MVYSVLKKVALNNCLICLAYFLCSCSSADSSISQRGILEIEMQQFNPDGSPIFKQIKRIWYQDSSVVQELRQIRSTGNSEKLVLDYPLVGYLYINLPLNVMYEFSNFSDTSHIIKRVSPLPQDQLEQGWIFYSHTLFRLTSNPELLKDTIKDGVSYKQIKFHFDKEDPNKWYRIGWLRCDGCNSLFSLEHDYSPKVNCTMTKNIAFKAGSPYPYGSLEVRYLSDTLTDSQKKVIDAWDNLAKKNL